MRVALLTLHTPLNFGSALQAYALCRVLREDGHDVRLVDYHRPGQRGLALAGKRFTDGDHVLPVRLWNVVDRGVEAAVARRRFAAFLRRRTTLTRRYTGPEQLAARPPAADAYLTGSDQVWNSLYNGGVDRALYLDFGPPATRRVSYAASFGLDAIPDEEREITRTLLARYTAVSVRERGAVDIVRALGVTECAQVLDPTLLLSGHQWADIAESRRGVRAPYVLLYSVEEDWMREALRVARHVARQLGLPIVQVTFGGRRRRIRGVDRTSYFTTPQQFLGLFRGAGYVVTSSFHGTTFSVNFNKPFVSIAPPLFASRAGDFLASVGLSDRFVTDGSRELPPHDIDYDPVNRALDRLRHHSRRYLKAALPEPARD
ncbi:polysaccharide pyruvyl transferase family protein [Streptomyces sp. NPDC060020]|uniref:polysaccharide pyruvyl transferase family protein n=1 Tax=Streptomyces sp. NPDC060020 TaxID=3347038 RepID=UPI0036C749A4